jgi:hypothetical protein
VSGPTLIGFFNDDISVIAVSDGYIIEFNGHYLYLNYVLTIPTAFRSGPHQGATSASGDSFSISQSNLAAPYRHLCGPTLSGQMTLIGASLLSVALGVGNYVTALPNDMITTNVIAAAIPPPAAAPPLPGALGSIGLAARRRKG